MSRYDLGIIGLNCWGFEAVDDTCLNLRGYEQEKVQSTGVHWIGICKLLQLLLQFSGLEWTTFNLLLLQLLLPLLLLLLRQR